MSESRRPCPWCGGNDTGCPFCDEFGTVEERRKPTANDRAVARIKEYITRMDAHHLSVNGRVAEIIREEESHG